MSHDMTPIAARPLQRIDSWSEQLDCRFTIRAANIEYETAQTFTGPISKGVRVGVMSTGMISGRMEGPFAMAGPSIYLLASNDGREGTYTLPPNSRTEFVAVVMDPDEVEDSGLPLDRLIGSSPKYTRFLQRDAEPQLQALALQISACPLKGPMRQLYLAGKSLELTALIAGAFCDETSVACAACPFLCGRDLKRIYDAREILLEAMEDPPSLKELSRQVGLNVKKLTTGFRSAYGMSVYEMLQEHRLEQAYILLTSGKMNVSQVAYRVGYSVAHFSTLFRRRFGVSPSELR